MYINNPLPWFIDHVHWLVAHLGPHPVGSWMCFIMLAIAILAGITNSSHLAGLQLFYVLFICIPVGWVVGF